MEMAVPPNDTTASKFVAIRQDSSAEPLQGIQVLKDEIARHHSTASVIEWYAKANVKARNVIHISPEFCYLPMLKGRGEQLVLLYKFVEALDEVVSYEDILARFPMLSYAQIAQGLEYLRQLALFNSKNVDIDALEESLVEADPTFQDLISKALDDEEVSRVLSPE